MRLGFANLLRYISLPFAGVATEWHTRIPKYGVDQVLLDKDQMKRLVRVGVYCASARHIYYDSYRLVWLPRRTLLPNH